MVGMVGQVLQRLDIGGDKRSGPPVWVWGIGIVREVGVVV